MRSIISPIATDYLSRIRAPTPGLYPAQTPVTIQAQEQSLRDGVAGFTIVHVPSRHHTIQNLLPATLARQVLYFEAWHDGTACDEP